MGRPLGSKNKVTEVTTEQVVENVPRGEVKAAEPKVRKFSTDKDHMGEGEPLCFNCGHRLDMHHTWTYHQEQRTGTTVFGNVVTETHKWKEKQYIEGNRPCQHACLCTNFQ